MSVCCLKDLIQLSSHLWSLLFPGLTDGGNFPTGHGVDGKENER